MTFLELLFTGKLSSISAGFCNNLCTQHKVILASEDVNKDNVGKTAIPFSVKSDSDKFAKLFRSYNFETVIFFSESAEGIRKNSGELGRLENVLKACVEFDVGKVIYISSTSVYSGTFKADESTKIVPADSYSVELAACEQLCDFYRANEGLSVVILHVPYLYGYGENSSVVAALVKQAVDRASIRFPGSREQICEYLSQEDLSGLLMRIVDDWPNHEVINVPGGSAFSFSGLGVEFIKLIPTLRISYAGGNKTIPAPISAEIPRKEYDWVPTLNIADDLPRLIREYSNRYESEKGNIIKRIKAYAARNKIVVIIAELLFGFLIMELLNTLTTTMVQFQYVDFRLLYVVVIATLHGLGAGMAASALACVSMIISYSQLSMDWRFLLYNIDNWLPFACYLIIAAIAGYTKDKYRNQLMFLENENNALEERYFFLNELYGEALKNKGEFKAQILSYSGSFGRIYEVARRLNSLLPEVIFKEAIGAMEELLLNQTISIYTINEDSGYARLAVCSQKMNLRAPKSLKLDNYSDIIESLRDGEVWSNNIQYADNPDYCAAVFREGKPVVLIMIQKVKFEQMAMYYQNLIRVLCGLIQVSLLRAYEHNERWESERYITGTRIINKEHFKMLLEAEKAMAEKEIAEFSLLHIFCDTNDRGNISETVLNTLRGTDYIGLGEDEEIYVILSQAGRVNIDIIAHRLREAGIIFEVTDKIGAA